MRCERQRVQGKRNFAHSMTPAEQREQTRIKYLRRSHKRCFVLYYFFVLEKKQILSRLEVSNTKEGVSFCKRDCHAPSCRAAPCWILDAEESGASLAPFPPHSCPFLWETKEKNMPTMTAFSFPSHGEKREMKATCRRQKKAKTVQDGHPWQKEEKNNGVREKNETHESSSSFLAKTLYYRLPIQP